MNDKYILVDKKPQKCPDLMEWAKWFETSERRLFRTEFPGAYVSTVFLGLDHRFDEAGPPLLFETMIFGGPHDGWQERCSTFREAEIMHSDAEDIAESPAKTTPEER